MTANDTQVRILMREHQKGKTQEQAAASGNLRSPEAVLNKETARPEMNSETA